MKKVLLIGQFTEHFREINKKLMGKYEVRACVNKLEIFKGMFKLNKPDIVVMLMNELDETNIELLRELWKEYKEIPVVYTGISFEDENIPMYLLSKQFEYIEMPYTMETFIEKIEYALEKDISEDDETDNPEKEKEDNKADNSEIECTEQEKERSIIIENRRKSILIVDDSGIYLRLLKGLLEDNYDTYITTSGLEAISLAHKKHPDLILLDYEMPLFDGRETMVKIRESEETKDIPIIFVTAVNRKENIKAVLSLKPAGYLLKPIDKDRLFQNIKDIIGE